MIRRTLQGCLQAPLWLLLAVLLLPSSAAAQPFGWFLVLPPAGGDSYVEVPSSPALTPSSAFTIELWAWTYPGNGCQNLIGKGYTTSYWIGRCGNTLRSYRNGVVHDGGTLPSSDFVHIAVTYDGVNRKHYIDGELVGVFPETGPVAATTKPFRIGGDADYSGHSFTGSLFEVRLWNVARTQAQIRQLIVQPVDAPTAGLVSVWHLDHNAIDTIGGRNGHLVGGATYSLLDGSTECTVYDDDENRTCLLHRFQVAVDWVVYSPPAADGHLTEVNRGPAKFVPGATETSVIAWFFSPDNWELLVKMPAGTCSVSHTYWVFGAATTNVHFKLRLHDVGSGIGPEERGAQRIYFNFSGPPAPAVIDTAAFATCVP
jgi:hypothetical protein